jgi:PAS domain S-box-containing protein
MTEPDEIYQVAAQMVADALEMEKGVVLLYDEARQQLVGQAPAYGLDAAAAQQIRLSVKEGTVTRSLWEREEPWAVYDFISDPRFEEYRSWSQPLGIHALLVGALRVGQRPVGAILLANKRSGERFTRDDVARLRALADQISAAWHHAQTIAAQALEVRRSRTLTQITSLLHATLDEREVLRRAASLMVGAVGADRCTLFLIVESEPTPVLSVARVEAGQPWHISETVDDERARWFREHWRAFAPDRATILEDVFYSPLVPSAWTTQWGIKTLVLAPLQAQEVLWGYMMIEYGKEVRHFEQEEVTFMENVVHQSALALSNARFHSAMQRELTPLRASAATYSPLVEGAGAAILVVQDGRYSYTSGATVELLGYSAEELAQMHLPDIFAPHSQTVVIESYERLLEGQRLSSLDAQALRKDGQEVTLTLTGSLIEFEDQPAVEFIAADTTVQQVERDRRLQASKLEAVNRLIGNLVGEVRNALTPVVGFTELTLEIPDLSPEVRSNLEIIAQGAERARKTFDTLATWAEIRHPTKTHVSINQLLEQIVALRQYEWHSHQIEVELGLEKTPLNTSTQADPQQLQIAFLAIMDNAQEALMDVPGRRQLVIRTRHKTSGFWEPHEIIEISFQDNGPGIPRENLPRVFDPFFSTKPPTQALGLGLWIAYQVIKNHNGEIYVRSREGEGATFIIELPVLSNHALPEE